MQKLFYLLFLFFSALVAIAKNTGDYDAAAAAAKKGGTTLAPGKQYAFTGKGKNHHRRLIVGVVSGTKDNYDFKADMFELRIDGTASANPLKNHGKACGMSTNRDGDNWTCDRPQGLKFKGEVGAELTKVDIKAAG